MKPMKPCRRRPDGCWVDRAIHSFIGRATVFSQDKNRIAPPALTVFPSHFGVRSGRGLSRTENQMRDMCQEHGIEIIQTQIRYDQDVWLGLSDLKQSEPIILRRHDAEVATYLRNDVDMGNLFATWDFDLQDIVSGQTRILATNPAQLVDLLATTHAHGTDTGRSAKLQAALIHIDERATEKLAKKIEAIRCVEHAYQLKALIDDARDQFGAQWQPSESALMEMVSAVIKDQPAEDHSADAAPDD